MILAPESVDGKSWSVTIQMKVQNGAFYRPVYSAVHG